MWRIGIAFLLGHCCVHGLSSLPSARPYGFVLVGLLVLGSLLRARLATAFLLGIAWSWLNAHVQLRNDLPHALEGRDLLVEGRIASLYSMQEGDPQFELDVTGAQVNGVPAKLRLTWYDTDQRPRAGELWQFVVRLKRRSGFANPGGFDYEGYLFRSGIGGTGYVRHDSRNVRLADASIRYGVLRIRAWVAERIALAVDNSSMLGILQGLAVGDTQAMRADQWRVFAATGTTHLMAISGLHIGMVAALAAAVGGAIVRWRGAQARRLTAIHGQAFGGIGAALAYSLLAGMSVPTQRTLLMLCVYFAARFVRRETSVTSALGLALVGVLLADPFAPLAIGAWLSFGAVAVILMTVTGRLGQAGKVAGFVRVQWAVTLGLLPLLVLSFGSVSLVSPVANAIAVPTFTLLIVPLVLLGALLAAIWIPAGAAVLGATAYLLEWVWPLLAWLAEQPLAMWYPPELPVLHSAALVMGSLLFVVPGPWPLRLVALSMCIPVVLYRPETPAAGDFEVTTLDVGQGLAVVIRTQSHTLLYDTGPAFRSGRNTGELVVLPFLRSRGVRSLDRLIVSHGDLDHQGGMASIMAGLSTRSVLVGPSVSLPPAVDATQCRDGQRWTWDGVEFAILHPGSKMLAGDNDTSCVLRVAGRSGAALLTGDIEAAAELELLERNLPVSEIVVVAHHGSRTSSTPSFVSATGARLAIVSAGYRNRWNFPRTEVMERWTESGADVASTIESGAIEIALKRDGGIVLREYRRERRRYWSAR